MNRNSQVWIEAHGDEYGDFLRDMSNGEFEDMKNEVGMAPEDELERIQAEEDAQSDRRNGEWELIQAEDAHLDSMYEQDLMDLEDFGCMYDSDPNPYDGTYSEE